MATEIRRPTADNTDGAWTPSAGTDTYATVDEVVQDDSDFNSTTTNNSNNYFDYSAFTIPGGATVNSVSVVVAAQETGSTFITGIIRVNGTVYSTAGTAIVNATPWNLYTTEWLTNPNTGAAWTVDDANGSGAAPLQNFGYSSRSVGAGEAVDVSWCYVIVDYTEAAGGSHNKLQGRLAGKLIGKAA